ncbi:putative lysyl-tRNA synthetase 1 lyss [Mycobacterium xenopi 3993]|nr:putative lysyl-tRNA synthetase 1 lyss [Mycobacterium xenopi 3993]
MTASAGDSNRPAEVGVAGRRRSVAKQKPRSYSGRDRDPGFCFAARTGAPLSWQVVSASGHDIPEDLPEQFRIRRDKRARLLARGHDPYPVAVARTHTLAEIRPLIRTCPPTPQPATSSASQAG